MALPRELPRPAFRTRLSASRKSVATDTLKALSLVDEVVKPLLSIAAIAGLLCSMLGLFLTFQYTQSLGLPFEISGLSATFAVLIAVVGLLVISTPIITMMFPLVGMIIFGDAITEGASYDAKSMRLFRIETLLITTLPWEILVLVRGCNGSNAMFFRIGAIGILTAILKTCFILRRRKRKKTNQLYLRDSPKPNFFHFAMEFTGIGLAVVFSGIFSGLLFGLTAIAGGLLLSHAVPSTYAILVPIVVLFTYQLIIVYCIDSSKTNVPFAISIVFLFFLFASLFFSSVAALVMKEVFLIIRIGGGIHETISLNEKTCASIPKTFLSNQSSCNNLRVKIWLKQPKNVYISVDEGAIFAVKRDDVTFESVK